VSFRVFACSPLARRRLDLLFGWTRAQQLGVCKPLGLSPREAAVVFADSGPFRKRDQAVIVCWGVATVTPSHPVGRSTEF